MSAESPATNQWPDDEQPSSKAYALSGQIMLASIITLFVIVFFLVLLHLYSRWYLTRLHRRNNGGNDGYDTRRPHPRSTLYYVNNNNSNRGLGSSSTGLDGAVLKLLPVFVYSSDNDVSTSECAVCLSEFEEGETGRVLPNCKHRFHTECIDLWFFSNSTCPLCRSPVEPVQPEVTELMKTTSLGERRKRVDVRIDVPVNESVGEDDVRMTSPGQGFRSPGSRLLSLTRLINISRVSPSAGVGPSCVPGGTESDVELARHESGHESTRPGGLG